VERLIADTGYFVALGRRDDPCHAGAQSFAARFAGQLVTTSPVIVEACHFLAPQSRLELLDWAIAGTSLAITEVPVESYRHLSSTIRKYADRNVDFADASLVWLAESARLHRILTVDRADFTAFRLKNGRRFELIDWF